MNNRQALLQVRNEKIRIYDTKQEIIFCNAHPCDVVTSYLHSSFQIFIFTFENLSH